MTNEDAQKLIKQEKHVNGQPIVSRRYFVHTYLMQRFRVTGSLPQNINWAIKAEYASLMFEANDKIADTPSLDKAIERAMKAVCLVEVWTETK